MVSILGCSMLCWPSTCMGMLLGSFINGKLVRDSVLECIEGR